MVQLARTHLVSLYRLTKNGTADQKTYKSTAEYTDIEAAIFPASADLMVIFPGVPSLQLYEILIFTKGLTIKSGDKLVSGSDSWIIKGAPQKFKTNLVEYTRLSGEAVV